MYGNYVNVSFGIGSFLFTIILCLSLGHALHLVVHMRTSFKVSLRRVLELAGMDDSKNITYAELAGGQWRWNGYTYS